MGKNVIIRMIAICLTIFGFSGIKVYAAENIIIPANVVLRTTVVSDDPAMCVDYLYEQEGVMKHTGFIGNREGLLTMIQPDPGTRLYIIGYPQPGQPRTTWSSDPQYFTGNLSSTSSESNYVSLIVPATGGSIDVKSAAASGEEGHYQMTKSYDGMLGIEVSVGLRRMELAEIAQTTGDDLGSFYRVTATVANVDKVANSYQGQMPTGNLSPNADALINGTYYGRTEDLENQIRILREQMESLQNAYDALRDASDTDGKLSAINNRNTELQDIIQTLQNENAALSLSLRSKGTLIDELNARITELTEQLATRQTQEEPAPTQESEEDLRSYAEIKVNEYEENREQTALPDDFITDTEPQLHNTQQVVLDDQEEPAEKHLNPWLIALIILGILGMAALVFYLSPKGQEIIENFVYRRQYFDDEEDEDEEDEDDATYVNDSEDDLSLETADSAVVEANA